MGERTRAYRMYERHRAISRKKAICNKKFGFDWYPHDGQYDKGKIHCGCGLCKFGRKYGIPTVKRERELEYFDTCLKDYYANGEN